MASLLHMVPSHARLRSGVMGSRTHPGCGQPTLVLSAILTAVGSFGTVRIPGCGLEFWCLLKRWLRFTHLVPSGILAAVGLSGVSLGLTAVTLLGTVCVCDFDPKNWGVSGAGCDPWKWCLLSSWLRSMLVVPSKPMAAVTTFGAVHKNGCGRSIWYGLHTWLR